ncbi:MULTISPECIES: glycosyltransferase [unclassified Myroides]|uniref:glycosyltransferase n=1 Tax=unclassified Myroides TaxID=2642485 RepID=UPI003D2F6BFE
MRKILVINTSTIRAGGAIQVAINVIKQSFKEQDFDVYYITNKILFELIATNKSKTLIVSEYPSNIFATKVKREIRNYAESVKADVVYSVGAPSYINFKCKEVLRLTNPWLIEKDTVAYKKLSFIGQFRARLEVLVKKQYLNRAKYFITQTLDAKQKIVANLGKKEENVYVIQNVYSYNFEEFVSLNFERDYKGVRNIICVSANYPHKNIELLVGIAGLMKKNKKKNYKFFLTIPIEQWEGSHVNHLIKQYDVADYFVNLGKLKLDELVEVYKMAHVFFLPTLLEVFSVSFLESMIFDVPIITTDFSFNKTICGDAAMYLEDPFDVNAGLSYIELICEDEIVRNDLIRKGKNVLDGIPSNKDVYENHFIVLKQIVS